MDDKLAIVKGFWGKLFVYDMLRGNMGESEGHKALWRKLTLLAIPVCFVVTALIFIAAGWVDNQGQVCSSALPAAMRTFQNVGAWITRGMWFSPVTPTPMYRSALALVFAVFGYDTRFAMGATCVLSAIGCLLLGLITQHRFGHVAGIIAQILYLTAPVVLRYSLSGGYYIWATTPLLLSIYLLDLSRMRQSKGYYYLAATALLCAGMSRPEVFALAVPIVILFPVAFRYRPFFLAIAWSYPITSILFARIHGWTTPGAIRVRFFDSAASAVATWLVEVFRLGEAAFSGWVPFGVAVVALLFFGFGKTRFFSLLTLAYMLLFLALHMVGRLEQSYPHYYIGPVIFLVPFAAGAMTQPVGWVYRFGKNRDVTTWANLAVLGICLFSMWIAHPLKRADVLAEGLTYQIDGRMRDLVDCLSERAKADENIVVDWCTDTPWLHAELTNSEGRSVWFYCINHQARPYHGVRAEEERIREYNDWVASGFATWAERSRPEWLVTPNNAEWLSTRRTMLSRMNALRSALRRESFHDGAVIKLHSECMTLRSAFEGPRFTVFRIEYGACTAPSDEFSGNLVENGNLTLWTTDAPDGWKLLGKAEITPSSDPQKGAVALLSPRLPDSPALIHQIIQVGHMVPERILRFRVTAKSGEPGKFGMNFYYRLDGERHVIPLIHPGDGQWHTVESAFILPKGAGDSVEILVGCRPGSVSGVSIAEVALERLD